MASLGRRQFLRGSLAVAGAAGLAGCGGGKEAAAPPPAPEPAAVYRYGEAPLQVADLYLPGGGPSSGEWPVVVLVHGGYWRAGFDRELMVPLVPSLLADRWAVWNLDYRVLGRGGGWPETYADTAAAVDQLAVAATDHPLALDGVMAVGHSAGSTLALWSAARRGLPTGAPGAEPGVGVSAVVAQAGLNDLVACARGPGGAGCSAFMGVPADGDGRYQLASPAARLPLGRPQLVVHGSDDGVVPLSQSEDYAASAEAAGDDVTLEIVAGADHLDMIDPEGRAWSLTQAWLDDQRE